MQWGTTKQTVDRYRHEVSLIKQFELYCSGCEPPKSKEVLDELGITEVVRLGDAEDYAEYVTHDGINYCNVHLEDNESAEMPKEWLDEMTNYIFNCKGPVLVHCYVGMSRSVSLCIAYLMRFHHMRYREALDYMVDCRPCSSPNIKFRMDLALYDTYLLLKRF